MFELIVEIYVLHNSLEHVCLKVPQKKKALGVFDMCPAVISVCNQL